MRMLIVSNRLPFTVIEKEGMFEFKESVGGMVSGLSAYIDSMKTSSFIELKYIWIGWPGITIEDIKQKEQLKLKALSDFHAYPIFLSEEIMDKFYHGFCNKTIWPLFHYFPFYTVYDEDSWKCYKHVNEMFCEAIMEIIKPDDIVWVHDYHLMLLPGLLKKRSPENPVGFFLHIPFPSFEIFRMLPKKWQKELLEGIVGADLAGFHTHEYTQYFLRCVLRILGHEHNMGKIITKNKIVRADTYPMGIDFPKFNNHTNNMQVQKEEDKFDRTLANYRIILSIDRLDYTKGIINRLRSYEIFLERYKQWHKKLILLLIVVPSRIGVEHYQQNKKEIDELVGRINGKFGSIDWTPISYQYKFLPFGSLIALYKRSDIALITPLRDGMNLVSKEYIAARTDKTGVLILSEMAGASKELGEAIIINPNNTEEIIEALKEALEMPREEQIRKNHIMQERLKCYDVVKWAHDFLNDLISVGEEQKRFDAKLLNRKVKEEMKVDFNKARRRLILLDYDGTLVPFAPSPEMAVPNQDILNILISYLKDMRNEIVLLSGRDKDTLGRWFELPNINIVAEHGILIKEKNCDWSIAKQLNDQWKTRILPLLRLYVDRVPGSFIEEKGFSIAWHYRKADPEQSSQQAKDLMDTLVNLTANIDVQIMQGNKVVEIRNTGFNKGTAGMHWISKNEYDFILAIGDDFTDEDLFRILPDTAYSIRVGITQSYARFNLHNYVEVIELLRQMVEVNVISDIINKEIYNEIPS
ncbi:MAG: Bifunctional trehalose-6-phosphate synthase/phosphatase [Candidatus Methanoperedens nitroreducens]|uniref:Bifunctional trehalose-6-phosphate synthase/phosphatase n=1 Tax=Candidatus Methanoperedens nitratireducens TaxID=1392998 RepID=A0A0P8CCU2_9EURY|nr:bifunctional alpha,alpha-trehalose-phosphate synthase (UDP-forming)/trehalose-phosphatase [Candidatus Methanoperedens sp. BLZ2]KAB2943816.1 MAG: bifunctional alpha,alpha-trehalose-phosphate synthase (UDP-forming)/trehalose-phosphatase [Candidatus Methanoperedens sp.]KPQ44776.1 MAG: Bifunctional trehalose-6-phosphate synthase/phosphatase [Candidatus Methanoperedens sp. BLZ1]MBZ0177401.1 bifunctional alpha,alpha-trehalose-phosphate synthase (UDP-forming)/trehalose-phosphatase [Candidatus Methan